MGLPIYAQFMRHIIYVAYISYDDHSKAIRVKRKKIGEFNLSVVLPFVNRPLIR